MIPSASNLYYENFNRRSAELHKFVRILQQAFKILQNLSRQLDRPPKTEKLAKNHQKSPKKSLVKILLDSLTIEQSGYAIIEYQV